MKHAPGAPVDIAVRQAEDRTFEVEVVTAAGARRTSWLEASGGGHGLEGMRRRVASCGGTLTIGPTADGGWHVSASFPAGAAALLDAPRAREWTQLGQSPPRDVLIQ